MLAKLMVVLSLLTAVAIALSASGGFPELFKTVLLSAGLYLSKMLGGAEA